MCFNFVLNRRFSFSQSRHRALAAASSWASWPPPRSARSSTTRRPCSWPGTLAGLRVQVAALLGIAVGTLFNFIASRYLVFRGTHIRAPGK